MTYEEARVFIDDTARYGAVLGLASVTELVRRLGNPQDDLKFVHIAGTNGKGSTLAYISTILKEAGYGWAGIFPRRFSITGSAFRWTRNILPERDSPG